MPISFGVKKDLLADVEWSDTLHGVNFISDGRDASLNSQTFQNILTATSHNSGKKYCEVSIYDPTFPVTNNTFGIKTADDTYYSSSHLANPGLGWYTSGRFYRNGSLQVNDGGISWSTPVETIKVLMCAIDFDTKKIWFGSDGVWKGPSGNSPDPATGTDPAMTFTEDEDWYVAYTSYYMTLTVTLKANATYMTHAVPSGFDAWEVT